MDLLENLGIEILQADSQKTIVAMPVSPKTKQPYGLVHGGLNSVLAETAASVAANAYLSAPDQVAVGLDIQTHHLKAVTKGILLAEATPLHLGQTTMVYAVRVHLKTELTLTSFSTVTLMSKKL